MRGVPRTAFETAECKVSKSCNPQRGKKKKRAEDVWGWKLQGVREGHQKKKGKGKSLR